MSRRKNPGKLYLVTGGSGSGKSAYAEEMVIRSGCVRRVYLATMKVFGEEGRKKVERHKKLRQGKGFVTVECPSGLKMLVLTEVDADVWEEGRAVGERAVLLECMGNLAANELFEANKGAQEGMALEELPPVSERAEDAFQRIKEGINRIREQCSFLLVVSDEVFSDGVDYGEETNRYIRLLGALNCWLAEEADRVIEVVYGIPVTIKGEQTECFD